MADYRDPEPLLPVEPDYEQSKVDKRVHTYADHVRYKIYGVDVREALARGCEISALIAQEAVDKANSMQQSAERAEAPQKKQKRMPIERIQLLQKQSRLLQILKDSQGRRQKQKRVQER